MEEIPSNELNYTNLSKKELQDLCKKYGLSPYNTKPNLLSSLSAHFQKMNLDIFSEMECSNVSSKSLLPEPLSGEHLSEATKVNKGRNGKFSASFGYGQGIVRDKNDQEVQSQTVKNNEKRKCKEAGVRKVTELENVEDIRCSMSKIQKFSCSSSKKRENTCSQNLAQCDANDSRHWNTQQVSTGMNISAKDDCFGSITEPGHPDNAYTMDGAFPSHLKPSTSVPSFEFFVSSEEGINLFVDLNSSLSDWSKRLENEVSICQGLDKDNVQSFCQELQILGNETKMSSALQASPVKLDYNSVRGMVSNGQLNTVENQNMKLSFVNCHNNLNDTEADNCSVPCPVSTSVGAVEMQVSEVASHRQSASLSTVVNDDSSSSVLAVHAVDNSSEVHYNASSDYEPATVDELEKSVPDGSKTSRTSKERLEDSASGSRRKRKRNNVLYQEGYQHGGRILRSANRLGQKVFHRRSMRLVSK